MTHLGEVLDACASRKVHYEASLSHLVAFVQQESDELEQLLGSVQEDVRVGQSSNVQIPTTGPESSS